MNTNEITDGITNGLEVRKQRGLEIAAMFKISRQPSGTWVVPSQSGNGRRYGVSVGSEPHCTCADHEVRGCKCKHIYAVELAVCREKHSDGSETVTQTLTVSENVQRPTYSQNWTAYNAAQTTEKAQFQLLLRDLCAGIEDAPQGNGRPRLPLSDAIFSAAFKVYSTVSGRRFTSDLCDACSKGYISRVPHFNSIYNYLEMPEVTPILKDLIVRSSLPLRAVETDFAVDSTGFGSCRFVNWFSEKYGRSLNSHDWVKVHLMCGVKTNIVTSVEVSGRFEHDYRFLPSLVNDTAQRFTMNEVSADKGYTGRGNLQAIAAVGATPYIAFKNTAKIGGKSNKTRDPVANALWDKMLHFYSFKREEFLAHYHKRSNVESTFMAIKAKFGDAVRSKGDVAQGNEVLCKVLCHNICVVIQSMHELGIEPMFDCTKSLSPAQKVL